MDRVELLPASARAERLFLLDLLAGRDVRADVDPDAFLAVVPRSLYPFLHRALGGELFASHYRQNAMLHLRRLADLRRAAEALSAAGIDFLVLKGPVLAATVYADPAARTMLDLDLLVRDLEPAMAALTAIGYSVPERFAAWTMNAGDAPPLWNGSSVVELHALLDSAPDHPAALDAAWASARPVDLGHGLTVRTLGHGELLAHVIMHLSRHHRFEGELRSLLDVALLMRSADVAALDWNALAGEWRRRGLAGWIGLTLALAHELLGIDVPEPLRAFWPQPEALELAAEQLWIDKEKRVSGRITNLFTRQRLAPLHAQAEPVRPAASAVPSPARRAWQSARNVIASVRNGTLRPRNIAHNIALLKKRERMWAMVESASTGRPSPTERPTRRSG